MNELDRRAARQLRWFSSPITADGLDFSGATLNTCFNAADRHVATGSADEAALSGPSADTGNEVELDFAELTAQSAKLAGILRALEVRPGDTVLLRLPNCVERVIGMLAAARLGASFMICEAVGTELDAALPAARAVLSDQPVTHERCIRLGAGQGVMQRAAEFDYRALMRSSAVQPAECVDVPATATLRMSSGTTGPGPQPACDNGRHAVDLVRALEADVTAGAVAEHPCLAFAPLLLGRPAVLPPA